MLLSKSAINLPPTRASQPHSITALCPVHNISCHAEQWLKYKFGAHAGTLKKNLGPYCKLKGPHACQPVSDVASRRHLRSAGRRLLNVPRYSRSTYAWRAVSVAGPLVTVEFAAGLPEGPGTRQRHFLESKHLTTFLFAVYTKTNTCSALKVLRRCAI